MKRVLLAIPFFLVLFACNQYMLGAGQAVKNLITTPYRGIANMISNNTYDNLREKTLEDKRLAPDKDLPYCAQEGSPSPLDTREPSALMDAVRETVCSCKAWGSCGPQTCPCAKLCPENLSILKRRPLEENTRYENSLSFRNEWVVNSEHDMPQGFCWGHASVTSKFNRLAFFKPSKKPPYDLNSKDPEVKNKAIAYYKNKVDKILNNEATDIEGFTDLLEFSGNPSIESYIADRAAEEWAERAMTFQGLRTEASRSPMSPQKNRDFLKQIEDKLNLGQQPQIVYEDMNQRTSAHALLVSHVKMEDGKKVFCLRDNNEMPLVNTTCARKMILNHEGKILHRKPTLHNAQDISVNLGGENLLTSTYVKAEAVKDPKGKTVVPRKTRTPRESKQIMEKIVEMLKQGKQPSMDYKRYPGQKSGYSLKVIDFEKGRDGSIALCFGPKPSEDKCSNSVIAMAPSYNIQVAREYTAMANIELAHNDNRDAVAQVDTLVKKCKSEKGCDKEE